MADVTVQTALMTGSCASRLHLPSGRWRGALDMGGVVERHTEDATPHRCVSVEVSPTIEGLSNLSAALYIQLWRITRDCGA